MWPHLDGAGNGNFRCTRLEIPQRQHHDLADRK